MGNSTGSFPLAQGLVGITTVLVILDAAMDGADAAMEGGGAEETGYHGVLEEDEGPDEEVPGRHDGVSLLKYGGLRRKNILGCCRSRERRQDLN